MPTPGVRLGIALGGHLLQEALNQSNVPRGVVSQDVFITQVAGGQVRCGITSNDSYHRDQVRGIECAEVDLKQNIIIWDMEAV